MPRARNPADSFDRRSLLLGAVATAAMSDLVARMLIASAAAQQVQGPSWQEEMRKILGNATPVDGQLTIEVPEIAENGNMVPFTTRAASPMTEADHVRSIHVLATANPVATIGSFHFTPASGVATVSSRIRLAQTQDVVVLAQHSTGRFVLQRREVKVTIGGCGG